MAVQARTPSQGDRLLEILKDGRWHSSRELHARVFCVLHSRISALRDRGKREGFTIEHRGGGAGTDAHDYRYVRTPSEGAGGSATDHVTAAPSPGALPASSPVRVGAPPSQLSVFEAA